MILMEKQVAISLLGTPRMQVDDKHFSIHTRYRKAMGLLGYLAAEPNKPHSRELLATLFWPELDDTAARVNLRQVLSSLARSFQDALIESPIIADRQSISFHLRDSIALDILQLESPLGTCKFDCRQQGCHMFDQPLTELPDSLLTGDFLAAYSLPGCEEFEEWLTLRRAQFRIRQVNLLQTLVNCSRNLGDTEQAIAFIQQLIRLDPDDESHLRLAMCLYIEVGRREAALKAYDTYTQRLERELGVQPQAPTIALHETIASSPATIDSATLSGKKTFPAVQKLSLVVVLRIQWVSLSQDPEETAQSLYDADQLAKTILSDKLEAFQLSGAGKGTLFYFGWPNAQCDAAWSAARGAIRFLATLKSRLPLVSARIGIHAGRILSGTDEMTPDLIGDISEEVSQLTSCAQPGEVMISHVVQQLLGTRVAYSKIGERRRQIDGSIQSVYRLNDTSPSHSSNHDNKLVGRDAEMVLLNTIFSRTSKQGVSHSVVIEGVTGIGKTALITHFLSQIPSPAPPLLNIICTPDARSDALVATLRGIRLSLGFNPDTPLVSKSGISRQLQQSGYKPSKHSELLIEALSELRLPAPTEMKLLFEQLCALTAILLSDGGIIWIEDAQWSDKTTVRYIDYLEHHLPSAVLILVTQRWSIFPRREITITLPPLDHSSSMQLLNNLPASMKQHYTDTSMINIAQLGRGNPFFMSELTKNAVLKDKVPDTVIASFSTQIDSLEKSRDLAMIMAIAGSEISLEALQLITEKPAVDLRNELEQLQSLKVIQEHPPANFRFSHPLLRLSLIELTTNSRQRQFRQVISTKLTEPGREVLFLTEN